MRPRFALIWPIAAVMACVSAEAQPGPPNGPETDRLGTDRREVAANPCWGRFLGPEFEPNAIDYPPEIDWTKIPACRWSIDVGEGYGIGAVCRQHYYHFDGGDTVSRRGVSERLRAFDLATGKEVWSSSQAIDYRDLLGYENGPRSTPTVDGDQIFTLGVTGRLTCRQVNGGEIVWTVDTNSKYGVVQNFFGVGSSPLVLGDRVIVMVGGSPPEDQEVAPMMLDRVISNGSAVVAFDRNSGRELWKCGQDLASYSSPRTMRVGDRTLVLVFARSGLMAIDPDQGTVLWKFDHRASNLESVNAMMPVVDGAQVFISECYEVGSVLLEVDRDSSSVVWQDVPRDRRAQAMRCHWSTPVLIDGYLYGCSGRNGPDSDFRCVEWATGKVAWSDPRRIRSSVLRVGDHLIVWEERGSAQVIRPHPDRLEVVSEWDLSRGAGDRPGLGFPCWAAPLVAGKALLLRGDRHVICLDLAEPK